MAFEVDWLVEQLEQREVDGARQYVELAIDEGTAPERIWGVCQRYDAKRQRGEKIGPGWIVTKLQQGGLDPLPEVDERLQVDRRTYDEERVWAELNLPELTPTAVLGSLSTLRFALRREPTVDEVRDHAVEKKGALYGEPNLALKASYTPAERLRMEAELDDLKRRRPELFALEAGRTPRPRRRRRRQPVTAERPTQ